MQRKANQQQEKPPESAERIHPCAAGGEPRSPGKRVQVGRPGPLLLALGALQRSSQPPRTGWAKGRCLGRRPPPAARSANWPPAFQLSRLQQAPRAQRSLAELGESHRLEPAGVVLAWRLIQEPLQSTQWPRRSGSGFLWQPAREFPKCLQLQQSAAARNRTSPVGKNQPQGAKWRSVSLADEILLLLTPKRGWGERIAAMQFKLSVKRGRG